MPPALQAAAGLLRRSIRNYIRTWSYSSKFGNFANRNYQIALIPSKASDDTDRRLLIVFPLKNMNGDSAASAIKISATLDLCPLKAFIILTLSAVKP